MRLPYSKLSANYDIIEDGIKDLKDNGVLVVNYKRKNTGFDVELYELTEAEKQDFLKYKIEPQSIAQQSTIF
jgi:hypothetical protein